MIQQPFSPSDTTSPLILSASGEPIRSASISSTPSGIGFSRLDVATARVMVKRLVESRMRPGPSELMTMSDWELELWLDQEALRYLEENLKKRQEQSS